MSDRKEKDKSLARAKKSAIKLGGTIAKEGLNCIPFASLTLEVLKILVGHALDYRADRAKSNVEHFFRAILTDENGKLSQEMMDRELPLDDYTALITYVLEDEEDQKIPIYSRLYKSLLQGKISIEYKRHLIKSSRELSCSDFDMMRRIYIRSKYDLKGEGTLYEQLKVQTMSDDPIKHISTQNLIRLGFLHPQENNIPPRPTKLLDVLVESVYPENELLPQAIGVEAWRDTTVFVASIDLGKYKHVLSLLSKELLKININATIAVPRDEVTTFMGHQIIILCGNEDDVAHIVRKHHSILSKKHTFVVLVETERTNLKELPNVDIFSYLDSGDNDIRDLIRLLEKEVTEARKFQ